MVVNNPNNWHWVDKNCIDWSKKYFKEKLENVSASKADQVVKITSVRSIEGDVEVCQRKGKVISLFDLKIVLAFEGSLDSNGEKINTKGTISVPEVAYDTEEDEYQFQLTIDNDSSSTEPIKQVVRKELEPKLRKILNQFGKDLISTHGNDIQLPEDQVKSTYTLSNQKSGSPAASKPKEVSNKSTSTSSSVSTKKSSDSSVPKYNTSSLHLGTTFITTSEQIYETLLDKARVAAWTRAPPQIEAKEGSSYELFNGNIQGKILKLEPTTRIVMLWRLSDWKAGHFANLEIKLNQSESETKADILFTGIPIGEEEKVENNFQEYYIKAIKLTFGFGIVL